ncbi:MAG: hypothetical protein ACRET2_13750 [Steroidobacteraceae bacterium]
MLLPILALAWGSATVSAHAIAGMRLFPSTLSFDDPGIGAELPIVFEHDRADGTERNVLSAAFTKPITSRFSLVAGGDYQRIGPDGMPTMKGWDNFSIGGAWQVYKIASSESLAMVSLTDSVGGTGSRTIRSSYSTWTPEFAFGQGLGTVATGWIRPLAVTGAVSVDLPTDSTAPRMLDWALSIQYSIPYLQDFVKDVGIRGPLANLIPIVEVPMQTCLDRGCGGHTTGSVNPGVIWIGRDYQWGVELEIPTSRASGESVGVLLGFDFYLDDLFPRVLGAPVFE